MKTAFIVFLILMSSCEGSIAWRQKHGLIKYVDQEFEITSIRVDDDSEYHITAFNKNSGQVKSLHDIDANGYVMDHYSISYSNSKTPKMIVRYSDEQEAGNFYEDYETDIKIILPYGFKIDTFDD